MSQEQFNSVIARALEDIGFRRLLKEHPDTALSEFDLTGVEKRGLKKIVFEEPKFEEELDKKVKKWLVERYFIGHG